MPGVQAAIIAASKLDADLKNEPRPTGRVLELPLTETFDRFREIFSRRNSVTAVTPLVSEVTKNVIDTADGEDTYSNYQIVPKARLSDQEKLGKSIEELEISDDDLDLTDIEGEENNDEEIPENRIKKRIVRRRSDDRVRFTFQGSKKSFEQLGDINKENSMEDLTAQSSKTLSTNEASPPRSPGRAASPGENSFNTLVNMTAPETFEGYKYVQNYTRPIPLKPKQHQPQPVSISKSPASIPRPLSPGENSFASLGHWISGNDTIQKY